MKITTKRTTVFLILLFSAQLLMGQACFTFTKNGKSGIRDKQGKAIVDPKYKSVGIFQEGFAWVEKTNGKYNFVDIRGKEISKTDFNAVTPFKDGMACVGLRHENKSALIHGYIDITGALVVKPKYLIALDYCSGAAFVTESHNRRGITWQGLPYSVTENKSMIIDKKGNIVFTEPSYTYYFDGWEEVKRLKIGQPSMSERLFAVASVEGLWGFMNIKQEWVISPGFREVGVFDQGFCRVKDKNDRYGYINSKGVVTVPLQYIHLEDAQQKFKEFLAKKKKAE